MGIIYDSTQTLGLIATGVTTNPLSISDNVILIGGSHKTLPAPSCGIIMTNNEIYAKKLQKHITPDYLRNTQPNHSAALLLSLIEQEECGYEYQKLIVDSANMLGSELSHLGFNLAKLNRTSFTFTHQLFLLMSEEETDTFYMTAKHYNITLNKKHKKLFNYDGIRLGTQQIARYNWSNSEIKILAQLLYSVKIQNETEIKRLRSNLISQKIPHFTYEDISIK